MAIITVWSRPTILYVFIIILLMTKCYMIRYVYLLYENSTTIRSSSSYVLSIYLRK